MTKFKYPYPLHYPSPNTKQYKDNYDKIFQQPKEPIDKDESKNTKSKPKK